MKKVLITLGVLLGVIGLVASGVLLEKKFNFFSRADEVFGDVRYPTDLRTILDAAASTSTGQILGVSEYAHIVCSLAGVNSPTATVKFAGSISETPPNIAVAQSATNTWDYIDVNDLQNGASIDGDTGISFTGSNDVRQIEVNTSLLKWFTAALTSYTNGTTTLKCRTGNNQ